MYGNQFTFQISNFTLELNFVCHGRKLFTSNSNDVNWS